jgi:hypothetical protein
VEEMENRKIGRWRRWRQGDGSPTETERRMARLPPSVTTRERISL